MKLQISKNKCFEVRRQNMNISTWWVCLLHHCQSIYLFAIESYSSCRVSPGTLNVMSRLWTCIAEYQQLYLNAIYDSSCMSLNFNVVVIEKQRYSVMKWKGQSTVKVDWSFCVTCYRIVSCLSTCVGLI